MFNNKAKRRKKMRAHIYIRIHLHSIDLKWQRAKTRNVCYCGLFYFLFCVVTTLLSHLHTHTRDLYLRLFSCLFAIFLWFCLWFDIEPSQLNGAHTKKQIYSIWNETNWRQPQRRRLYYYANDDHHKRKKSDFNIQCLFRI